MPETLVTVLPIREAGPAVRASTAYMNTPCKLVNTNVVSSKVGHFMGEWRQVQATCHVLEDERFGL